MNILYIYKTGLVYFNVLKMIVHRALRVKVHPISRAVELVNETEIIGFDNLPRKLEIYRSTYREQQPPVETSFPSARASF